jgi:predicted RNA-binding protein
MYGLGAIAALAGLRSLFLPKKEVISCGPEIKNRTHRMLTQDGTLVEVDEAMLSQVRKRISDEELRNFIQRTPNPNRAHETE